MYVEEKKLFNLSDILIVYMLPADLTSVFRFVLCKNKPDPQLSIK